MQPTLHLQANDVSDIGDISPDHEWMQKPEEQFPAAMKYITPSTAPRNPLIYCPLLSSIMYYKCEVYYSVRCEMPAAKVAAAEVLYVVVLC